MVTSIGKLEHHIHEVFANVRLAGTNSVYCNPGNAMNQLESYCDGGHDDDSPPIILLGEKGTGKSALLANWIQRRMRDNQRSRGTEFIFYHAVGCSRQSTNVNSMLRRLMTSLRDFFELTRAVTLDENRLSWDLPLFLEQGAKKGKIVIVIDGLHRLIENSIDGLTWLPLTFHSNVKVVMAAGLPDSYFREGDSTDVLDVDMRKPRIFIELERRGWQTLRMEKMTYSLTKEIVTTYIQRSVQSETARASSTTFMTDIHDASTTGIPGLLLFEQMVNSIIEHQQGHKPTFLNLVLRMARWLAARGWSLWHLLDEWISCEDADELLESLLTRVEIGYNPSKDDIASAQQRSVQAGGYNSLRTLYPWHPSFQEDLGAELENEITLDLKNSQAGRVIPTSDGSQGKLKAKVKEGSNSDTSKQSILRSLGDQRWRQSSDNAEERLQLANLSIMKALSATVEAAKGMRGHNDSSSNLLIARNSSRDLLEITDASIDITRLMDNMKEMESSMPTTNYRCPIVHNDDESDAGIIEEGEENGYSNSETTIDEMNITELNDKQKSMKKNAASKGLDSLPIYLRGGKAQKGFGQLLGDALSLLYVARHGLTEDELWTILGILNQEKVAMMQEHTIGDDARALIKVCYGYRGQIEDFCRSSDRKQRGRLTRMQIMSVFRHLNSKFDHTDLDLLFSICDMWDDEVKSEGGYRYLELIARIEKTERSMRAEEAKATRELDDIADTNSLQSDLDTLTGERREITDPKTNKAHTIGPLMEEALLSFLVALGVLHSPQNRTLVLPFDNESLRSVVYTRYIAPNSKNDPSTNSGDEDSEGADNSGNRNVTANVKTHANLTDSEGNFVLNSNSVEENKDSFDGDNAGPLSEKVLSTVLTLGESKDGVEFWHTKLITYFQKQAISLRRCEELLWHLIICRRWYTLKDTMADLRTFDLMFYDDGELREEYMHYWKQLTEGPLYNSESAERQYNTDKDEESERKRILVELDTAAALGLTEKEARKALLKSKTSPFDLVEEFHRSLDHWIISNRAGIHAAANKCRQISDFMAEYAKRSETPPQLIRLALPLEILEKNFDVKFSQLLIPDLTDESEIKSIEELEAQQKVQAAAQADHETRLYCYKRWMWTQFPLLALRTLTDRARDEGIEKGSLDRESKDTDEILAEDGLIEKVSSDKSNAAIADQTFMRNFVIKKSDPTKPPIFATSDARMTAMIANSVTPAKEVLALKNITKFFAEKGEKEAKKPGGKFKRTIAEDKELFKAIPHAYASIRSTNRDTKFPTIDSMLKQRENKSEGSILMTPQEIARLGDPEDFGGGAVAEIHRLQEEEDLAYMNSRRTCAIPGSKDEIVYGRELERMGRLRTIADQTREKCRLKREELDKIQRAYQSRMEDDEYVLAGLVSGEAAIIHMEERLVALKAALAEAHRTSEEYKKLMEFLDRTPPMKPDHLASLEQEVTLARQQLADLMKFRQSLYIEFDLKGTTRRTNLRNKLKQYKKLRKGLKKKAERTEKSTKNLSVQLKQIDEINKKESLMAMGIAYDDSDDLMNDIQESNDEDSESVSRRVKNLNLAAEAFIHAGKRLSDEELAISSKVKQAKMSFDYLMHQTGSTGEENFLERFFESINLTETLKSQQNITESRVSQLRQEHEDLSAEIIGIGEGAASMSAEPSIEMAARQYDSRTFNAEIRLGFSGRLAEQTMLRINEIRVGVTHVIALLQANSKLLHNLPSSSPPSIEHDHEIVQALSWCEERVLAINEALVLDTGSKGQPGSSSSKGQGSIYDRQKELAHDVEQLIIRSPSGRVRHKKRQVRNRRSNVAHYIIGEGEDSPIPISPRNVMVTHTEEKPYRYERSVDETRARVDAHQTKLEAQSKVKVRSSSIGVAKFLQDALATSESQDNLRRANTLANKKQGRNAGYGLALEDLLKTKGEELLEGKSNGGPKPKKFSSSKLTNNGSNLTKLDFDVPSRGEVKVTAEKRRKKLSKEMNAEAGEEEGGEAVDVSAKK